MGTDLPGGVHPLIELAIREKMGVEGIERLCALKEREEARLARAEFMAAMAAFKAACPPVPRRSKNAQFEVTKSGMKVPRTYAALEDIEATIRPHLGANGLSFRWSDSTVEAGKLTTACIVSHVGGHSESSSVVLPVDAKSGANEQQKYGSAMTYAQRYSLIQALGLTSCDEDDDGNGAPEDVETITPEQVDILESLLDQRPAGAKQRFIEYYEIESLDDLPAARFDRCVADLKAKIAKGAS